MSCQNIQDFFSAYLDKALSPEEEKMVRDHLTGCKSCQSELMAMEQTWDLLSEWKDIKPDPNVVSQFYATIPPEVPWYQNLADRFPLNNILKTNFAPASGIGTIIIIGLLLLPHYFRTQESDQMLSALNEDALEMVSSVELTDDYELIQDMDFFNDLEAIESMEEGS